MLTKTTNQLRATAAFGFLLLASPLAIGGPDAIVRNFTVDDTYYYLQIARNLADGYGSTFDRVLRHQWLPTGLAGLPGPARVRVPWSGCPARGDVHRGLRIGRRRGVHARTIVRVAVRRRSRSAPGGVLRARRRRPCCVQPLDRPAHRDGIRADVPGARPLRAVAPRSRRSGRGGRTQNGPVLRLRRPPRALSRGLRDRGRHAGRIAVRHPDPRASSRTIDDRRP